MKMVKKFIKTCLYTTAKKRTGHNSIRQIKEHKNILIELKDKRKKVTKTRSSALIGIENWLSVQTIVH